MWKNNRSSIIILVEKKQRGKKIESERQRKRVRENPKAFAMTRNFILRYLQAIQSVVDELDKTQDGQF